MAAHVQKPTASDTSFGPNDLRLLCQPNTVIDVGVGYGTYALYQAFPDAHFVLVEPLRDYADAICEISAQYSCDVVYKAVSDAEGHAEFLVESSDLQKSSFSSRTSLTKTTGNLVKRNVEVTTLDAIARDRPSLREPILLKLDTEGHELRALNGALDLLKRTETVIAEVSIAPRFEGGYEFEDLVLFMKTCGFSVFTILNVARPPREARARFADIVFKRIA